MSINRYLKKPSIPTLNGWPQALIPVQSKVLETLQILTGRRGEKLEQLAGNVSVDTVAERLNEVIRVLQDGPDTEVVVGSSESGAAAPPSNAVPQVQVGNLTDEAIAALAGARVYPDLIINGDMRFRQRVNGMESQGTGWDIEGAFGPDRWAVSSFDTGNKVKISQIAAGAHEIIHSDGTHVPYYLRVERGSVYASNNVVEVSHGIDVESFIPRSGDDITLTFMVRATVTGTYSLRLQLPGSSTSLRDIYVTTFTVNASATWEEKTVTFPAPSNTVLDHIRLGNYTQGATLFWVLQKPAGTGGATLDTWTTGVGSPGSWSFLASTQANALATAGNVFELAYVHTSKQRRSHEEEQALCLRYYQQSAEPGGQPYSTTNPDTYARFGGYDSTSAGKMRWYVTFGPAMRRPPIFRTYKPGSATLGKVNRTADNASINNAGAGAVGPGIFSLVGVGAEIDMAGFQEQGITFQWTATAEIVG